MKAASVEALETRDRDDAGTCPMAPSCLRVKESRLLLGGFDVLDRCGRGVAALELLDSARSGEGDRIAGSG